MPCSCAVRALALAGGLVGGLGVRPAAAQQPAAPWQPFQWDAQLALQLPALPRQLPAAAGTAAGQSYVVQSPQALCLLVRKELPAAGPLPDQDVLYTGLAQATLTHWHAVGVRQAAFRVGDCPGVAVDFRVAQPRPGQPAGGTVWVVRIHRTVYVAQWLAPQPTSPANAAQRQRFAASWARTHLPAGPPAAAAFRPFRVGHFRVVEAAAPGALITRTDTAQAERNPASGLRITYGLRWPPVGYDLRQRYSTSPHAALLQAKVIHVRITAVQGDTYWYWATIDDFVSTGRIQRVK